MDIKVTSRKVAETVFTAEDWMPLLVDEVTRKLGMPRAMIPGVLDLVGPVIASVSINGTDITVSVEQDLLWVAPTTEEKTPSKPAHVTDVLGDIREQSEELRRGGIVKRRVDSEDMYRTRP